MFTETAYEAFMKLKQVRRRSWGGGYHIYIYIYHRGVLAVFQVHSLSEENLVSSKTHNHHPHPQEQKVKLQRNIIDQYKRSSQLRWDSTGRGDSYNYSDRLSA